MYKTAKEHYKQKFGCSVYKLSIDAGFTCPNRDGRSGTGGCSFCSEFGGGEFAEKGCGDITLQLEKAKSRVEAKNKSGKYIAYFQAFTNTYADTDTLKRLYYQAICPDYIVGLAVATRPDCLPRETVELLSEINKIKPVSVELGLQTSNDTTAERINRGYKTAVYTDAVSRLKAKGVEVVTHIIIGLPNETKTDVLNTVKTALAAETDGVKFHLLHILKGSGLETEWRKGNLKTLTLEEYGEILKEAISLLPPEVTVHRITGDGDKKTLLAPLWSADKKKTLNYLNKILKDI